MDADIAPVMLVTHMVTSRAIQVTHVVVYIACNVGDGRGYIFVVHAMDAVVISRVILVSDVVSYNTLGHCFFLEDGNEQNNVFAHNLGLVTKAGTLLPSDRNAATCAALNTV